MLRKLLREPSVWVAVFGVLASLLGFFREQAIAAKLGLSIQTDAFYTAMALASVLPGLFSNALNATLGAHYAAGVKEEGELAGSRALGELMGLMLVLAASAAAILAAGVWVVTPLLDGRNHEKVLLSFGLTSVLAWTVPALVFSTGATICLNLKGKYISTAATALLLPVLAVIGVWTLPAGAWSVAGSVLLGSCAQAGALGLLLHRVGVSPVRPRSLKWAKPLLFRIGQAVVGGVAFAIATCYVQALAANGGATDMASFNFGTKVTNAVTSLAAGFLGTFLGPLFARKMGGLTYNAKRLRAYLSLTAAGAVGLTPALYFGAEAIIRLLLKRGAFAEKDVAAVAVVQSLAALQLPVFLLALVLGKVLAGQNRTALLSKLNWLYAFTVLGSAQYLKSQFGVGGLALATGLGYLVLCLVMSYILFKETKLENQ